MPQRTHRPTHAFTLIAAAATIAAISVVRHVSAASTPQTTPASPATIPAAPGATTSARDGSHDFDFEIGAWKTHLKRRLHPLTGSAEWVEYDGTTVVRKVWDGKSNLVELEVDGKAGHIEGASWRLYNPASKQWSLNFSNSLIGTLSTPTIGEFKNGRGEFYSSETLNERSILVRFVIAPRNADACDFEQAFSADGGKTWEVNWIATDTRVHDRS